MKCKLVSALFAAVFITAGTAWGHGDLHGRDAKTQRAQTAEETPFGRSGDAKKVTRTIRMNMDDSMHYSPSEIRVKQGETIRFVVKNSGKLLHEIVLGTMNDLKEHAELMKKFPEMDHDEPHMAHVPPGKTGTLLWQFSKAGDFYYACLIPGHLEAGMIGKILVSAR